MNTSFSGVDPYWVNVAHCAEDDIKEALITGYLAGKPFSADGFHLLPKHVSDLAILDFGCGIGRNFNALARHSTSLIGFDIPEMIDACRRISDSGFAHLTSNWDEVRDMRFDLAIASLVLQHLRPGSSLDYYLNELSHVCPFLYVNTRAWCDGPETRHVLEEILRSGHYEYVSGTVSLSAAREVRYPDSTHLEFVVKSLNCTPRRTEYEFLFDPDWLSYPHWVQLYGTVDSSRRQRMLSEISTWQSAPTISILLPTHNSNPELLTECLDSVLKQVYPFWELCIADDASSESAVPRLLTRYRDLDSRIKLTLRTNHAHISATSNAALSLATGSFVALLDHDDVLAEDALYHVARTARRHPKANLIFSDEDKIDMSGLRHGPYFKSDYNYDLLLAHNMISHLGVYRTDTVRSLGGFKIGFEGSQDYDLALRVIEASERDQLIHIPRVLYHWRTAPGSTAVDISNKSYAFPAAQKAISAHLARIGANANVQEAPGSPMCTRVRYRIPDPAPRITLIIPTRDRHEHLERCITSIRELTDYTDYQILIIDNDSEESATTELLSRLAMDDAIRVVKFGGAFNFSGIINYGVRHCTTELIGLINNDTEVISRDWLREMVSHALRPQVGIVGARLWYPDNRLQHAGVILGMNGVSGHHLRGLPRGDHTAFFGRVNLVQELSAVTGACMVMRRRVYESVGGMDEAHLPVTFNDIDLCLKVRSQGLRVIWTPYAELYHHESVSRGRDDSPEKQARAIREAEIMKERWGRVLEVDPAYSPNLSIDNEQAGLAFPPRVEQD